jgi:hypothetical protein
MASKIGIPIAVACAVVAACAVLGGIVVFAADGNRVAVEVRTLPFPPPSGATLDADGGFGCMAYGSLDGPHAVIELAEPLGDRRLVVTYDYGTQPS